MWFVEIPGRRGWETLCAGGKRAERNPDRKQDLIRCTEVAGEDQRGRQAADAPSGVIKDLPTLGVGAGHSFPAVLSSRKAYSTVPGEAGADPGPASRRGCARPLVGKEMPGEKPRQSAQGQGSWQEWPQGLHETVNVFPEIRLPAKNSEMLRPPY